MAETALKGLGFDDRELSVLLTGNAEVRELNRKYRGKDKPTDVLSFPMADAYLLGDIVISTEKVTLTCASADKPKNKNTPNSKRYFFMFSSHCLC